MPEVGRLYRQVVQERDAAQAEAERLKGCLIDLVTGRTCKAIEGSALIVAMLALGEPEEPRLDALVPSNE